MANLWNRFFYGEPTVMEVRSEVTPLSDPSTALDIPSRSISPRSVSTGDALGLSAVYRAVSVYSIAAKQLGIDVYRAGKQVDAPYFIKRPDINDTRSAFIEQTVVSLALNGNAYWLITRDNQSRVTNLECFNPLDVSIDVNLAGKAISYNYMGKSYSPSEIKHLKLLRVPGNVKGLGPIQAAQSELRGTIDTRDYATNWFETSGVPNGYLSVKEPLVPEDAKGIKDAWNATAGMKNGVAVLDNAATYTPVYLNPSDAQFIENQNFNVTGIARLFGIPLRMMLATVEGNSMTYANMSDERKQFIEFSLMQYLIEIEDALSSLLPGSQTAKFNIEALLRADTTARYASYQSAISAGFLTVNEVREIEGYEPLDTPKPEPVAQPKDANADTSI